MKKLLIIFFLAFSSCYAYSADGLFLKTLKGELWYGADSEKGSQGYSQTRISETVYNVRYRGTARFSEELAEAFMLYRTAELALISGYDFFRVKCSDRLSGDWIGNRTSSYGTVQFLAEKAAGPKVFEARHVIRDVGKKYKLAPRDLKNDPAAQPTASSGEASRLGCGAA